ncbi:hypothetical protein [Staphylococcus lutrae]|uniref:Helix-turn-helix type 11 domain-containing protein n=1 Tax=Staphylococcus lutrae TaxID=155085 RepID=A0AAC9RSD4_9STAP|nr:hypothetical protein [Staphylococcus lutrae]ARJ50764.1 hypothetical protein B5P37_05245 [Staphylococcus lutrae]PNZ36121.1 hypothetical protein CD134_08145 [Staphylococcus lutrae]
MNQPYRLLSIYTDLILGKEINKMYMANEWGVSSRTIQRDIAHIRNYIHESDNWHILDDPIIYNHITDSYYLNVDRQHLKHHFSYLHMSRKKTNDKTIAKYETHLKR